MKALRVVLALAIVAGFIVFATAGEALAQKGKKKKGTTGKVTKIETDEKDKDKVVSITLTSKKKKNAAEAKTTIFKITADTTVLKGAKKGEQPTAAKLSDLVEGKSVVTVVALAATANDVMPTADKIILKGGKKKKNAQ